MTNDRVFAGILVGILLDKEGFNPNNWDIKESPADSLHTIKNLDDSVEFKVYFEEKDEGFPKTSYFYTKYVDGIAEDVEAKSIKECIELGQLPKEKYHTGWNGKETLIAEKIVGKDFSNSRKVYGRNLLAGTSNVLTTVPDATGWFAGLPGYSPVEALKANKTYTMSCYLEPVEHDATIYTHSAAGNTHGTIIPAGSKGVSTLTMTLTPEDAKVAYSFWISFASLQKDNSTVSYKGFKLEKGSVATPWSPAPEDILN